MKKEMYKMLAAALMLTISGGVVGSAADTILDTVYVNADRDKADIINASGMRFSRKLRFRTAEIGFYLADDFCRICRGHLK